MELPKDQLGRLCQLIGLAWDQFSTSHGNRTARVLVKGEPGCGKSFVMIWWIIDCYRRSGGIFKYLVLVPYRRLALQLGDLFLQLIPRILTEGEDTLAEEDIMILQGEKPSLVGINAKKIVISTYEHGFMIISTERFNPYGIVIDEVHNIFYTKRGWLIEPFLSFHHVMALSGTLLKNPGSTDKNKKRVSEELQLLNRMNCVLFGSRGMRVRTLIFDMSAVDPKYKPSKTLCVIHDSLHTNMEVCKMVRPYFEEKSSGGLFYFCPTIKSVITSAYEMATLHGLEIINPLSDTEVAELGQRSCCCVSIEKYKRARGITSFGEVQICTSNEYYNNLYFGTTVKIYMDYSRHFDEGVRIVLSTMENCKLIVFCTTTLCEGLNLKSVKAVAIESGRWDERRVSQIKGRACRFGDSAQHVFKGRISFMTPEELILDPFDMLKIELNNTKGFYIMYSFYNGKEEENFSRNYARVLDFVKKKNKSLEVWLHESFSIDINLRYRDYKKIRRALTKMKLRKKANVEPIRGKRSMASQLGISNEKMSDFSYIIGHHSSEVAEYDAVVRPFLFGLALNELVGVFKNEDEDGLLEFSEDVENL